MTLDAPDVSQKLPRRQRIWLAATALSLLLLLGNTLLPYKVRFSYSPLNNAALIVLMMTIPIGIIIAGTASQLRWTRWTALIVGCAALLPLGFSTLLVAADGVGSMIPGDESVHQISEVRTANATYRLYLTNFGATTDFGLVLRREHTLLPGLRLVSEVMSQYHAHDASLERTPEGRLRLIVEPYGKENPGFVREFPP